MSCNNSTADFRPAQYNIQLWRNDSWSQTFALLANTVPIDLTGSTIEIQIRTTPTSPTALVTLTLGSGLTIGGTSHNQVIINSIIGIAAGSYVYDLTVVFPSTMVKTYVWGTFIVFEDITKI
jgi:hypothetical protein